MYNKKGNVFTSNTMFVLTSIFGIGLLVMFVINPVIQGYLVPSLLSVTSGTMHTFLSTKYEFILSMMRLVPYVIYTIGIIYILILIFRKERVDYYG